jgi:chemotaxis response regulator CheB
MAILDVEMPEMDGLATLAEIRKTYPHLPVIMFSALTERGASATLDALAMGATDYFASREGTRTPEAAADTEEIFRTFQVGLFPFTRCDRVARWVPVTGGQPAPLQPAVERSPKRQLLAVVSSPPV